MCCCVEVVFDALFQHSEAFPKGHVAHDVEGIEVEPLRYVRGLLFAALDDMEELVGVEMDSAFVITQCCIKLYQNMEVR